MRYVTIINDRQFEIEIQSDGSVLVDGVHVEIDFLELGENLHSLIQDTRSVELAIEEHGGKYEVQMQGRLYEPIVLDQRALLMAQRKGGLGAGSGEVHAPMPGLIVDILVKTGDVVEQGQTVIILESMKMQNELKAPRQGKIGSVSVHPKQTVDKGTLLLTIQETE
jgi:biotin carboxyl carrier protein